VDLGRLLTFAAERAPAGVAIVDGDQRVTYEDLARRSLALAAALGDKGIRRGDRIAIGMRNSAEHVVAFFAIQYVGAVAVPFNFRLKPPGIAAILRHAEARMALVDNSSSAVSVSDHDRSVCPLGWISISSTHDEVGTLADLERAGAGREATTTVDAADLSVILYTSGTTGAPKGVPLTHGHTHSRVLSYVPAVGLRFDDATRALGAAPLYHTVGLHYVLCVCVYLNATYYPVRDAGGAQLMDLVDQAGLTWLFGSPTLFHAMMQAAAQQAADTASVTHVSFGSAPMPAAHRTRLAQLFPAAQISEVYGTTEISIPFVTRGVFDWPRGALRPIADYRIRLVAPGGGPDDKVAVGVDGELIVDLASEGCFTNYWNPARETTGRVVHGWYRTGDAFRLDDEGSYFFTGRLDDMFISGGENIQPVEIEQVLSGHPAIADVAVIGTPHEKWGEAVTAIVVRSDMGLDEAEIERFCRASALDDFKRPRSVVFVEQIDRNASGKVVRSVLRERFVAEASGALTVDAQPQPPPSHLLNTDEGAPAATARGAADEGSRESRPNAGSRLD
jgi:2-furoate---CoA ligase